MRRRHRILPLLLSLCILLHLGAIESLASGREAYTYTVTFHAGNQGIFPEDGYGEFLSVIGPHGDAKGWQAERSADGSTVIVSGVLAGAQVSYDAAAEGAVMLPEGSRYYVMGVRRSGYDNADVGNTMFTVSKDLDHVVAYGIQGEMTSYRVNYQDEAGNTLADSRVYSGKVGDRPVAAYRYIEGWQPQAYNLTKTLSKNEAENVFTFVYTRVSAGGGSGGGTAGGTTGGTAAAGAADAGTGSAEGTGGTALGAADAETAGGAAATAGETVGDAADGGAEVPDDEVPAEESPRDLVDLDDEDTPLSDFPSDQENARGSAGMIYGLPVLASVSLLLAVVLAVCAGLRYRMFRRERDEEEEER